MRTSWLRVRTCAFWNNCCSPDLTALFGDAEAGGYFLVGKPLKNALKNLLFPLGESEVRRSLIGALLDLVGHEFNDLGIEPKCSGRPKRCSVICVGGRRLGKSDRLLHGWKRLDEAIYCETCWREGHNLRSIALPVVEPVGGDWALFRGALKAAWTEATAAANWMMTELYARDVPRNGEDEDATDGPSLLVSGGPAPLPQAGAPNRGQHRKPRAGRLPLGAIGRPA